MVDLPPTAETLHARGNETEAGAALRRRGARRLDLVPSDVRLSLSRGELESANLVEQMAVDVGLLLVSRFPSVSADFPTDLPLKARFREASRRLSSMWNANELAEAVARESDTVRSIAALAIAHSSDIPPPSRLALLRPFADDDHFAVREWAWIGLRDALGEVLVELTPQFREWARAESERIRRFASEITRPRGVWCRHLEVAKINPAQFATILDELMIDPATYVQLSVGNWLNDARRDSRSWVISYCQTWLDRSSSVATARICKRGLRNEGPVLV